MLFAPTAVLAFAATLFAGVNAVDADHGEEAATEMGPAAFLWPSDRVWGAAADNTAPCGSVAGVTNRTDFPLVNGQVAIVLQDESFYMSVAVSYESNPTSNADFTTVINATRIADLDPGHECYTLPDPDSSIAAGNVATLQIKYTSEFDTNENETYYACADITYVEVANFDTTVPCFNVSSVDWESSETTAVATTTATATGGSTASTGTSSGSSSSSGSDSSSSSGSSSSNSLSKGAIAGITVGVVAAGAIVLAFFIFFLRRRHQKQQAQTFGMADINAPRKDAGSLHSGTA